MDEELLKALKNARNKETRLDPEVIQERAKRILLRDGPDVAQEYLKQNGIEPDDQD